MTSRPSSLTSFSFTHLLFTLFILCASFTSATPAQSQVSLAWTTRFGGPGLVATPVAVVSDALGNVYATGTVTILSSSSAYLENLTIKYDPRGNILWKFWLGGPAHQAQGQAIELDAAGNVYVLAAIGSTSNSQATISNAEFAAIKYTSAGVREWVEYVPPSAGGNNFPTQMVVTPGGDVYVAGNSSVGSGNSSQALTVKYSTSGALLWSHRAPVPGAGSNSPSALGLDGAENVYVGVLSSHIFPTIYKYDSNGNFLTSFVVKGVDNFNAFHVDVAGNTYTAGCTSPGPAVVKYDPNGNELWTHAFTPSRCFSSLQLDAQGNVVLAQTLLFGSGGGTSNISVVKLDPSGAQLWQTSFNGSNGRGRDMTQGLAIDSANNIYVTGFTQTNPGSNGSEQGDIIAFKYSPTGQLIWSQRFADGSPSAVFPAATTLASGNSLIVAATSNKSTLNQTKFDWLTLDFTQNVASSPTNPIASIAQPLVPSAVSPGGTDFTLTVNGTGFVNGSVVLWNGQARPTTFVNQAELKATIRAADIAQASTGRITVQNPQPGGGLSAVAFLPVRTPAAAVNFTLVPVANSSITFPQPGQILTQAVDLNNDGKLDLIWTPNSNNDTGAPAQQVNVQLGMGDGSFGPLIVTTTFQGAFVVATGDFNGDGKIDLIVEQASLSSQVPREMAIMLGNGNGTFQAPIPIANPATLPAPGDGLISQGFVAVGDVNGDGKLDVVYANTFTVGGVTVLFGNGDGTFTAGGQFATDTFPTQLALADMNRDGKLDLVLAGAEPFLDGSETRSVIEVLLGNGDGTFGAEQVVPGTQFDTTGSADPAEFAVADFNGDGIPDLIYFSPRPDEFYPGKGDGTFGTPVALPAGGTSIVTALGDFNGDGKLDLLTQQGLLFLGNGNGTFSVGFNTQTLNPAPILAGVFGDFNNDGMLDTAGIVSGMNTVNGSSVPTATINIIEQVQP